MRAMFLLYAVLAGLVIGLVTGGSLGRLGDLRLAWAPLIALGMAIQVALFSTPAGDALGSAAPLAYIASNVAVLAAVWRNRLIPGLAVVLAGGVANLAAICANGGYMPVSAEALHALGRSAQQGYSNNRALDGVALAPLTDQFAMPASMPLANIFSVGDVLIGVGAAVAIVAAMHGRGTLRPRDPAASGERPTARSGERVAATDGSGAGAAS
jgi:hypothetical protein